MAVRQVLQEAPETTLRTEMPVAVSVASTGANAAEARVTPQELAQALAALESRQSARADFEAETIALSEAVKELSLNYTAERLFAEVEAQRAARRVAAEAETIAAQETTRPSRRRVRRVRWLRRLTAAGLFLSVMGNVILSLPSTSDMRTWWHRQTASVGAEYDPIVQESKESLRRMRPTLDDHHDGTLLYTDRDSLYQLAHGVSPSQIKGISVRGPMRVGTTQWLVTKEKGTVYIHGFSRYDLNEALSDFSPVQISPDQHSILLPVERLRNVKGAPETVEMTVRESNEIGDPQPATVEVLKVPAA